MNKKSQDAKKQKGQTLEELLRNSPLVGLDLDFSRPQDYPRDIDFGNFADEPDEPTTSGTKESDNALNLPRTPLESIALEGYQSNRLTGFQVRKMLGFETRLELDAFFKSHGISLEYTFEDLEAEREVLDSLITGK